jgi:hypothetical protein
MADTQAGTQGQIVKQEYVCVTDLDRALQNADRELVCRLGGEPQTEVRVWRLGLLQLLLKLSQPLPQQVAVVEQQPVPALRCVVQHLQGVVALTLAKRQIPRKRQEKEKDGKTHRKMPLDQTSMTKVNT